MIMYIIIIHDINSPSSFLYKLAYKIELPLNLDVLDIVSIIYLKKNLCQHLEGNNVLKRVVQNNELWLWL